MDKFAAANLLIGILIGAVVTSWFLHFRKPLLTVTVTMDRDDRTNEDARMLSMEGDGPDGSYQTKDLFFAATILTYRLTQESKEPFEEALATFCECVTDIKEGIENDPDAWKDVDSNDPD